MLLLGLHETKEKSTNNYWLLQNPKFGRGWFPNWVLALEIETRCQPTIVAMFNQQLLLSLNNNCWYSISKYAN